MMADRDRFTGGFGIKTPPKKEPEDEIDEKKRKITTIFRLIKEGRDLVETSDFRGALEKTSQGLEMAEKIGLKEGIVDASFSMGIIYFEFGDYKNALKYYQDCIKLYEELKNPHMVGSTYYEIGMTLKVMGDYENALRMYELCLKYAETPIDYILAYHQIGNLYFDRAEFDDALKMYFDALEKAKQLDLSLASNKKSLANILHEIGLVYINKDELQKGLKYVKESLEIKEEIGYIQGVAKSYSLLGNIYIRTRQFDIAREYFKKGLDIARTIGQPSDQAAYLEGTANAYYDEGNLEEAEKYLLESKALWESLGESDQLCSVVLNLGAILSEKKDYEKALDNFKQALEMGRKISLKIQIAKALEGIGRVYLRQDMYEESLNYYKQALTEYEGIIGAMKSGQDRIIYRQRYAESLPLIISQILAYLYTKQKNQDLLKEALGYIELSKAREVISGASGGCPQCNKRAELHDDIEQIREKLVEIDNALKTSARTERFKSLQEKLEADRTKLLDSLWDLEETIWKVCEDPQGVIPIENPVEITEKFLSAKQDRDTMVLEFMYLYEQLDVYLIRENQILYDKIEFTENMYQELYNLAQDVRNIRLLLITGQSKKAEKLLNELSKELYETLIPKSLRDILKIAKSLIIIPHAFLHNFPFEIFHDGENYWGLKYDLSQAMSLELLRISQSKQKSKKVQKPEIFMVGNPNKGEVFDTKDLLGTEERGAMQGDLPGAEEEIKRLSAIARKNKWKDIILLNEEATLDRFMKTINEDSFNIFHFAGHAIFRPEDPSLSCLVLRDNEHIVVDEIINKICFKEHPLVVLSSCESGTARSTGADELIGLSRALLLAGSPTMVLSRWIVMDEPTQILMEAFYRYIFEKKSISQALKLARREVRDDMARDYKESLLLILGSFTVFGAPGPLNF